MYVGKVILHNIRGFRRLDFDLARPDGSYAGWTVFTGDNGSGKSALLKAIAIGLTGKDTARVLQLSFNGWIRAGAGEEESFIELAIVPTPHDDKFVDPGRTTAAAFPARLVLTNGGKETTLKAITPPSKNTNYSSPERSIWSTEPAGWFACGYGPFRRVFGASNDATRMMTLASTSRFVTMFEEAASLAEADQWLRSLDHKKLENKAAEREQLDLLLEILRDDLMPNQITVDRVDSDGLWLRDRNGVRLSWRDMSDGYRSALAMLADIVRHLIHAYGPEGLTERDEAGRIRIKRSGVVLIDEIDSHLHPEWQREIGFWLKRHFPHVQFLVTTHSPFILQAADRNGLFHLPEPGSVDEPRALTDDEYQRVIASGPDTILLSPAFGLQNTRSEPVVEKRAEFATLKAKERAGADLTPVERQRVQQLLPFVTDEVGS